MRKTLLLGGPARVGKSTVAKEIRDNIDGQTVSGDAFNRGIRASLRPEWVPDLFVDQTYLTGKDFEAFSSEERIVLLRRRDRASWQFIKNYLQAAAEESEDDVFFYGNLWPDYTVELELGHRAVFLVDTSEDRADFLKHVRDTSGAGTNNWMFNRGYSDEKIEEWARFDIARSQSMIEIAETVGVTYFDIAAHGINRAQQLTKEYILS